MVILIHNPVVRTFKKVYNKKNYGLICFYHRKRKVLMNKKKFWNMNTQFLLLTILPILGLGLTITLVGYFTFRGALIDQANEELKDISQSVLSYFDMTYPGDYTLKEEVTESGEVGYELYKGGNAITRKYEYLDLIKENTGLDISLFYQDTRILTTIYDENSVRYVGSAAHPLVIDDVLNGEQAHFYSRVYIGSQAFFSYYSPVENSDGQVIGMIASGMPASEITRQVSHPLIPIVIIAIFICFAAGAISISASKKMTVDIEKINSFLSKVAQGILNTSLDSHILSRKDELGNMGRNAVNMQRSLRVLIEQDVLTGLNNRRYADKRLHQLMASNHFTTPDFTLAIGDIDYFKKVNDTYGHEAGDIVLKGVSSLIKKHVAKAGYAARWGGEEFLFVFEHLPYQEAVQSLEAFAEELRNTVFYYMETEIHVTMTIGVAICHPNDTLNVLLKCADDKLYIGKTQGRNQIVT